MVLDQMAARNLGSRPAIWNGSVGAAMADWTRSVQMGIWPGGLLPRLHNLWHHVHLRIHCRSPANLWNVRRFPLFCQSTWSFPCLSSTTYSLIDLKCLWSTLMKYSLEPTKRNSEKQEFLKWSLSTYCRQCKWSSTSERSCQYCITWGWFNSCCCGLPGWCSTRWEPPQQSPWTPLLVFFWDRFISFLLESRGSSPLSSWIEKIHFMTNLKTDQGLLLYSGHEMGVVYRQKQLFWSSQRCGRWLTARPMPLWQRDLLALLAPCLPPTLPLGSSFFLK